MNRVILLLETPAVQFTSWSAIYLLENEKAPGTQLEVNV